MIVNKLEKQIEISKEDLNWLIWGDYTKQIIATLTDEENPLKEFLKHTIKQSSNLTANNVLYNIINLLDMKINLYPKIDLNNDQINRLLELNKKYKFKSYDEDTKDAILIIKEYYCFNDFLEPQKLNDTLKEIQILLNEYGYSRQLIEIKDMIKEAFGYL